MSASSDAFSEFEHAGWSDSDVCRQYHAYFGEVTIQSVPAMLNAARVGPGQKVLDVCTGAGYAAAAAAARGAEVVAIDFSLAQVELARLTYPGVRFDVGDACNLSLPGGTFDAVVNGIGFPHFADPDAALREAFRMLRPGGRLAFTVYDSPDRAVGFGIVYQAVQAHGSMAVGLPQGPNYFLFSDPRESTRRLPAAGFDDVAITTVPQTWHPATADAAIDAILEGTVRASATLRKQTPEAWSKIRSSICQGLEEYKRGDRYDIPMPAVLISASRPSSP